MSRNWYYAGYTGYRNNLYSPLCLNHNILLYAAGICGGEVRAQR